jgi:hypothetical protein
VTWEDTLESDNTFGVSRLNASKEGSIEVRGIIRVAIASCNKTRVDSSRIAVPDIPPEALNRLTSFNIKELALDNDRNTRLAVLKVVTNMLSLHPIRASFSLGIKITGSVAGEDSAIQGGWIVIFG